MHLGGNHLGWVSPGSPWGSLSIAWFTGLRQMRECPPISFKDSWGFPQSLYPQRSKQLDTGSWVAGGIGILMGQGPGPSTWATWPGEILQCWGSWAEQGQLHQDPLSWGSPARHGSCHCISLHAHGPPAPDQRSCKDTCLPLPLCMPSPQHDAWHTVRTWSVAGGQGEWQGRLRTEWQA